MYALIEVHLKFAVSNLLQSYDDVFAHAEVLVVGEMQEFEDVYAKRKPAYDSGQQQQQQQQGQETLISLHLEPFSLETV